MDPIEPENGVIQRRWLEIAAGAGLLLLVVLGCLEVVLPFLSPILWAVVLCLSTWPLYEHLKGNRAEPDWLAALVMTLSLAVVAVAPFAIAFRSLSEQAKVVTKTLADEIDHWPPPLPQWVAGLPAVGPRIKAYWEESNPSAASSARRRPAISWPLCACDGARRARDWPWHSPDQSQHVGWILHLPRR